MEGGFELRLVLIGVSADEVDDLAIAVGGLFVIAARLVDHPQPIVSIVYFGVAHEQIAGGLLQPRSILPARIRSMTPLDRVGELIVTAHPVEGPPTEVAPPDGARAEPFRRPAAAAWRVARSAPRPCPSSSAYIFFRYRSGRDRYGPSWSS